MSSTSIEAQQLAAIELTQSGNTHALAHSSQRMAERQSQVGGRGRAASVRGGLFQNCAEGKRAQVGWDTPSLRVAKTGAIPVVRLSRFQCYRNRLVIPHYWHRASSRAPTHLKLALACLKLQRVVSTLGLVQIHFLSIFSIFFPGRRRSGTFPRGGLVCERSLGFERVLGEGGGPGRS